MKTINNKRPFYYQDIIYYIKNENTNIQKIEHPTTKNIYKEIIEHGSKQHKIAGETLWKKLLPTLDFQQTWKNTYFSYAQPFCTDLHYKLQHYSTKTNAYMHKCTSDTNPNCNYCNQIENNIHLFTKCPRINKVWTHYKPILTKLTTKQYQPQQHLLTISVKNQHTHITKLMLTITQIIIYEIWITRNNNKYDRIIIPQDKIKTKINAQIRNIIQTHYKHHKLNSTLNIFHELFCIKQALAKIENNILTILL